MKLFHVLFVVLVFLLVIILMAGVLPQVPGASGSLHPEIPGMFISKANIDDQAHTRWLGYLFGVGIIALFGAMLLIGNRKKGKVTSIGKWLILGLVLYFLAYTGMVLSHWSYREQTLEDFVFFMPAPTAWMIIGVWFVPSIITIAYILKFEEAIISGKEIQEFEEFIDQEKDKQ